MHSANIRKELISVVINETLPWFIPLAERIRQRKQKGRLAQALILPISAGQGAQSLACTLTHFILCDDTISVHCTKFIDMLNCFI